MQRIRAIAAVLFVAVLAIASPAHAQNKGGDETAPKIDSSASFTMDQFWNFNTKSQYFTDKGPLQCTRCGKFVVKKGAGDKIESIKFNKKSGEKVVEAYYRYVTFDGSGFDAGKSEWSGLTRLPAQTTLPDVEGVMHNMILISAFVNMWHRVSPMPTRRGLDPGNL